MAALGMTLERFRTTSWTEIRGLVEGGDELRERALAILVTRYWPPVYAELRSRGCSSHEAADITQAFFAQVVLGRGLFDRADRDKGKLRTLLLTALRNFSIDTHRREDARGGGITIPIDSIREEEARWSESRERGLPCSFDHSWALAIVDEALRRAEAHFRAAGKDGHWRLFEAWVVMPARSIVKPRGFADLVHAAGFSSPPQGSSALQVVKERVKALLREVVGETVADGECIDDEYAEVCRCLRAP